MVDMAAVVDVSVVEPKVVVVKTLVEGVIVFTPVTDVVAAVGVEPAVVDVLVPVVVVVSGLVATVVVEPLAAQNVD